MTAVASRRVLAGRSVMQARADVARLAGTGPTARAADDGGVLRTLIDAVPALLSHWDTDLRNVTANAACLDWFELSRADMQGLHARELLGDELYEANLTHFDGVVAGVPQRFERRLVNRRGVARRVHTTYSPYVLGGRVEGFTVAVTDAAPLVEPGPTPLADRDSSVGSKGHGLSVLVVDADHLARAGLRALLNSAQGIEVVGDARDKAGAFDVVRKVRADVMVIDAQLPGLLSFLEANKAPGDAGTLPKVVVLTSSVLDAQLFARPFAGVSAALSKRSSPRELAEAVRGAARVDGAAVTHRRREQARHLQITSREGDVLELLLRGLSNADIAARLCVSVETVKTHVKHLYDKLGVRSRQELIVASQDLGT